MNDLYITNLVACRPCNGQYEPNRAPMKFEVDNCNQRLRNIVSIVKPQLLVAVGHVAADELSERFSRHRIRMIKHPAFILRNGGEKGPMYQNWLSTIRVLKAYLPSKEKENGI